MTDTTNLPDFSACPSVTDMGFLFITAGSARESASARDKTISHRQPQVTFLHRTLKRAGSARQAALSMKVSECCSMVSCFQDLWSSNGWTSSLDSQLLDDDRWTSSTNAIASLSQKSNRCTSRPLLSSQLRPMRSGRTSEWASFSSCFNQENALTGSTFDRLLSHTEHTKSSSYPFTTTATVTSPSEGDFLNHWDASTGLRNPAASNNWGDVPIPIDHRLELSDSISYFSHDNLKPSPTTPENWTQEMRFFPLPRQDKSYPTSTRNALWGSKDDTASLWHSAGSFAEDPPFSVPSSMWAFSKAPPTNPSNKNPPGFLWDNPLDCDSNIAALRRWPGLSPTNANAQRKNSTGPKTTQKLNIPTEANNNYATRKTVDRELPHTSPLENQGVHCPLYEEDKPEGKAAGTTTAFFPFSYWETTNSPSLRLKDDQQQHSTLSLSGSTTTTETAILPPSPPLILPPFPFGAPESSESTQKDLTHSRTTRSVLSSSCISKSQIIPDLWMDPRDEQHLGTERPATQCSAEAQRCYHSCVTAHHKLPLPQPQKEKSNCTAGQELHKNGVAAELEGLSVDAPPSPPKHNDPLVPEIASSPAAAAGTGVVLKETAPGNGSGTTITSPITDEEQEEDEDLAPSDFSTARTMISPFVVLAHPEEFKNPSSFLKVYGDPLCGRRGQERWSTKQGDACSQYVTNEPVMTRGKDGNWGCTLCGNINYPRRFRCNKCHALRGPQGDAVVADYALAVYGQHLKTLRLRSVSSAGKPFFTPSPERHPPPQHDRFSSTPRRSGSPIGRLHQSARQRRVYAPSAAPVPESRSTRLPPCGAAKQDARFSNVSSSNATPIGWLPKYWRSGSPWAVPSKANKSVISGL